MSDKKFNPQKLKKLNNPKRLEDIPPKYIKEKLELEKADIIVEVGAGTGLFTNAFSNILKASTAYACDISDEMLNWMKDNIVSENKGIVLLKNEESSLPIESEKADLVFTIALHHELTEPLIMLKEAYRILKPGGKFFVVDWLKQKMTDGPPENIRYKSESVENQMSESGFEKIRSFHDMAKYFMVIGERLS